MQKSNSLCRGCRLSRVKSIKSIQYWKRSPIKGGIKNERKYSGIIITVAVLITVISVFIRLGLDITASLNLAILAIPIALVGYLLILAKRCLDAKASESEISTDLHAKIVLLNESMNRIEKKVEKIERILEKVSE
jgi:hypothetical protein